MIGWGTVTKQGTRNHGGALHSALLGLSHVGAKQSLQIWRSDRRDALGRRQVPRVRVGRTLDRAHQQGAAANMSFSGSRDRPFSNLEAAHL
jgi:hypothetical protein